MVLPKTVFGDVVLSGKIPGSDTSSKAGINTATLFNLSCTSTLEDNSNFTDEELGAKNVFCNIRNNNNTNAHLVTSRPMKIMKPENFQVPKIHHIMGGTMEVVKKVP